MWYRNRENADRYKSLAISVKLNIEEIHKIVKQFPSLFCLFWKIKSFFINKCYLCYYVMSLFLVGVLVTYTWVCQGSSNGAPKTCMFYHMQI